MPWDDLRVLLAIERAGSIARAARALGVAVSTVYRRLEALEAEHGLRAFDRQGGDVTWTETGRALVELAREVERRVGDVEARARDGESAGIVTLTAPDVIAVELCRH
ncbi:MAG: LysR family transcriptional regulator, partial [Myxococcota bacterium]|nr:LysR family transcriptional regulator [Myxococcota bacterium]